jgi:cyclohexanecarboxylate-CoA ligase
MEFDAILIPPRRAAMIDRGLWHDRTINDYLGASVAAAPDRTAVVAYRTETGETVSLSYRELVTMADRVAVGLTKLGIAKNDVLSYQLPNWWQFTVLYLACSRIGAVVNPLMHIFRERELSFMLSHAGSKAIVIPKMFNNFDFEAMLDGLRPDLPDLEQVIVIGGAGENSFEALLTEPEWESDPAAEAILAGARPTADDVTQVLYTSGTTGEPKGAMHSANTLIANIVPFAERLKLGADDVVLMASPLAHQTGFIYGLMMPVILAGTAVLQDVWDPQVAMTLIRDHDVSFTMASTPFLSDLSNAVKASGQPVPSLRAFLCAGAPIPGPLVEQARANLDAKIISAWGMTENGAVTTALLEDADERSANTDGCCLPGMEARIVDEAGKPRPAGAEGRLQVRGCSIFGGYLKRPQLNGVDDEGWFETGDMATLDDRGYIRICGRSKDIIIRGGENIPVVEIEALLYKHPAVASAAIVGYADERLGERACAFVTTLAGQSLSFDEMVDFLMEQKVAKQYLPERLVVREQLPATPTGKVQKFKLREMLKAGSESNG